MPNIPRLKQLDELLATVPAQRFDLGDWIYDADHPCGTVACAIGHACLSPVFQAQGLNYEKDLGRPIFVGLTSWDAVCAFFEIRSYTAERLFAADNYDIEDHRNPDAVRARIQEVIRDA